MDYISKYNHDTNMYDIFEGKEKLAKRGGEKCTVFLPLKYIRSEKEDKNDFDLLRLAKSMRMKKDTKEIYKTIDSLPLTKKCVLIRQYIPPQSTYVESMIKRDLQISNPIDNQSGDGCKNGINYEIKFSGHAEGSKMNFVQIRPDHNIDFYILIWYDFYKNDEYGKAYVFKIPSKDMDRLLIEHGHLAHGTISEHGKISHNNLRGRGLEYALRCNTQTKKFKNKKGKSFKFWQELVKFKVKYKPENF